MYFRSNTPSSLAALAVRGACLLTIETELEQIAAKAQCEPKLRFTSLAHHITGDRVLRNLCQIPNRSAPGVDGQTVTEAKETFGEWIEAMLQSIHRKGYQAPDIRRVYIPKPGKQEKRPLGDRLRWPEWPVAPKRAVLAALIERIEVSVDQIDIRLRPPRLSALLDPAATPSEGVNDGETGI